MRSVGCARPSLCRDYHADTCEWQSAFWGHEMRGMDDGTVLLQMTVPLVNLFFGVNNLTVCLLKPFRDVNPPLAAY